MVIRRFSWPANLHSLAHLKTEVLTDQCECSDGVSQIHGKSKLLLKILILEGLIMSNITYQWFLSRKLLFHWKWGLWLSQHFKNIWPRTRHCPLYCTAALNKQVNTQQWVIVLASNLAISGNEPILTDYVQNSLINTLSLD